MIRAGERGLHVIAVAAGRIINPRTARSQVIGRAVMAIGMALQKRR